MKTLAIASGKGGTGKTTLAVSLAKAFVSERFGYRVSLADCDAEEPNCHLFIADNFDEKSPSLADFVDYKPADGSDCGDCKLCQKACRFNAIAVVGSKPVIFPELCHGCGACELACPKGWMVPAKRRTGELRRVQSGSLMLTDGLLDVGVAMATSLIDNVKSVSTDIESDLKILDCPPGTSCAMIEAVSGSDFALFVTEPTPFGLHDLARAVAVARDLQLDFAVVVNRDDGRDDRIEKYCRDEGVELIASIADSREVATSYCRGEMPYGSVDEFTRTIDALADKVKGRLE